MGIREMLVLHRTKAVISQEVIPWFRHNLAYFQRWMLREVLLAPHLLLLLLITTTQGQAMSQQSTFRELKWQATLIWAIRPNPAVTLSNPYSPRAKVKHTNIKPRIAYPYPMQPWDRLCPPLTSTGTPLRDMVGLQFLIRTVIWTGLPLPFKGPVEMAGVLRLPMEVTLGCRAILRALLSISQIGSAASARPLCSMVTVGMQILINTLPQVLLMQATTTAQSYIIIIRDSPRTPMALGPTRPSRITAPSMRRRPHSSSDRSKCSRGTMGSKMIASAATVNGPGSIIPSSGLHIFEHHSIYLWNHRRTKLWYILP